MLYTIKYEYLHRECTLHADTEQDATLGARAICQRYETDVTIYRGRLPIVAYDKNCNVRVIK